MSDVLRKGWCPTLTRPMETGDGWLVRLHIRYGILSRAQARFIAGCAAKYGNGYIDLTSRGNVQIRGVQQARYGELLEEIIGFGFAEEPRPERPAYPDYRPPLGFLPVCDDVGTVGLGLAFGRFDINSLTWLADVAGGIIYLSPWRCVFIPGITRDHAAALLQQAETQGFITHDHDARRAIITCPGAPACSSAQGETRALALEIAQRLHDLTGKIHVSGCAKGCACPQESDIVVTAKRGGYDIGYGTVANGEMAQTSLSRQEVLAMVEAHEI